MWTEGVKMAKTARALDEAIANGKPQRIEELAKLLSGQVRNEVERQAELEGWYEEYEQATDHEHWEVETTVDSYGPVAFPVRVVPAKDGSSTPSFRFDRDLIESGLEQWVIQVYPEDDVDIRVSIGDNWFWAKMPEKLGPHAYRHFSDIAACEFTDAVASALEDLAEDPEDYGDELAYYDAYLHENVDLTVNEPSEPVSLKGEVQASRDAADALCADGGNRAAVSQQR